MSHHGKTRHLLLVPVPAYGHTRPLCALAARLAAQDNIIITLLIAPNWLHKAQADISAQFSAGHDALDRIRIASLFDSPESQLFKLVPMAIAHFPAAYETLLRGDSIKCASTGKMFPATAPPSAVILDAFATPQLNAIRVSSGTKIPVFAFISVPGAALIRMFCPESMGGRGDFGARIDAEALRVGKTADEIGNQIFLHTDGTVIRIPGMPAMYDYEHYTQIPLEGPVAALNRASYDMIMICDGIFAGTMPAYDGESLVKFEAWVRGTLNKPVYAVGPLLPSEYGTAQISLPIASLGDDSEIKSFLDSMKLKHGNNRCFLYHSALYSGPKVQDQLEDLVDTLIEEQFPFLLCHAAPSALLPAAWLEKLKISGIGMASRWAPQQTHNWKSQATGWFLTHCGHGGITEALASGIPMICWPFMGDQPIAAMHLLHNLNVAFHLLQTLENCRGEVGNEKRRNAERMRVELASAWAVGGSSAQAIEEFMATHLT
ncbi:hypothetical protein B0H14DRAFT_3443151 [Mycena olivaceomarginata]|nr:hypothetical protein B0H14DRAFT_3443151 [Mycena olivaceomarginata]